MSLSPGERLKVAAYVNRLPDRHVPPEIHAKIRSAANAITLPLWGREIEPQQIADLHAAGMTDPTQIHAAFSALPHPHAPNVTVGEYPAYVQAHKTFMEHSK